jgi:hypothetical protein
MAFDGTLARAPRLSRNFSGSALSCKKIRRRGTSLQELNQQDLAALDFTF